eukprot:3826794-Lingulodinium_polyedra.AAC.1
MAGTAAPRTLRLATILTMSSLSPTMNIWRRATRNPTSRSRTSASSAAESIKNFATPSAASAADSWAMSPA